MERYANDLRFTRCGKRTEARINKLKLLKFCRTCVAHLLPQSVCKRLLERRGSQLGLNMNIEKLKEAIKLIEDSHPVILRIEYPPTQEWLSYIERLKQSIEHVKVDNIAAFSGITLACVSKWHGMAEIVYSDKSKKFLHIVDEKMVLFDTSKYTLWHSQYWPNLT